MEALGIDVKLILAQIFNFVVLFVVLKKFLYKPLLKIFTERKEKIEEGLLNAEKIKKELAEIEVDRQKVLSLARKEAVDLILEQRKFAQKEKEEIIEEARVKASEEVKKGMVLAKTEMEKAKLELKKEAIGIAGSLVKKILLGLSEEEQHKLIKKSLPL